MIRAATPLPVPLSPNMSTVTLQIEEAQIKHALAQKRFRFISIRSGDDAMPGLFKTVAEQAQTRPVFVDQKNAGGVLVALFGHRPFPSRCQGWRVRNRSCQI